ncbi:MAG: SdrD B-like domain-containing protein, partial [Candidatus Thermoplasmatota archaeon]|nr:SdrD B-like domain-containing protein [Candidatus Thermoplasmatota archaeon]
GGGVGGVVVRLYTSGDILVGSTTTDSDGYYQFSVSPGDYYVEFVKPAGWMWTVKDAGCGVNSDEKDSDVDPVTGKTAVFTLASGASDLTRDAGLYAERAEIGDKVWHDRNYNGLQDAGEPGISNVKVELYKSGTPTVQATAFTDANGLYKFTNLVPGDYYLKFYIPTGSTYLFTKKDAGNDALDSDADIVTGTTAVTTLTAGEKDYNWDCGMYKKAKIGDFVWEDTNGDGIQNDGATGIAGLTVELYKWGGPYVTSTTTSGTGYYEFLVDPGQYYVKFFKGSYNSFTQQNIGNDDFDSDANSVGNTAMITVLSGDIQLKWDAGLIKYAALGDFVWRDQNGNGAQDAGELGMSGITVRLYKTGDVLVATTSTDADGLYLFSSLWPGDYYVRFTPPSDYFFSPRYATTSDKDSNADSSGQTDWVNLESGETDLTIDAGLMTMPETIKVLIGTIYYDQQLVDYLEAVDNEYNEIISSDTIIYLNYTNPSLLEDTFFRIWRWDSMLEDWVLLFDWMTTEEGQSLGYYPINLCDIINATGEEALGEFYDTACCDFLYPCCGLYEIEFYSVDIYDNIEPLKWNDVYVDCRPPVSTKTYGFPHVVEWWSEETVHWITSETEINITADDGYGSGIKEIWYKIYYPNGTLYTTPNRPDNFTLYTGSFTVQGPDGTYLIYYKALDHIGHVERERKQKFVLDNDPPLGDGTMLWVDPETQDRGQDVTGTLDIYLDTALLLQGIQFNLEFNPLLITIDSVEVNPVFDLRSPGIIDNTLGTVTGIFGAYDSGTMTGEVKIATITFTTSDSQSGVTPVVVTNVLALDDGGEAVPVLVWDGEVEVTGETVSCPYDLTCDGMVDGDDIAVVVAHFGQTGYPGVVMGDVSGPMGVPDGVVNIYDIIAVANHYGICA